MKDLLKQNKGRLAITACLLSVSAAHAQTVQLYNATTGAFISQSSFSTLSGGAWNGQALPKGNVLDVWTSAGVAAVMLLDPDGSLSSYRLDTGALITDYTPTTFTSGPYTGLTIAGNRNKIFGVYGTSLLMLASDGTVDTYSASTGGNTVDGTLTTMTGGPHAGQSFTSLASLNIGAYTPNFSATIGYLDPDGSVSFYNGGGGLVADPTATTFTGGLLDGQSFAALLGKPGTGNQPGVTYLGLDYTGGNPYVAFYVDPVPEPSTIALCSVGGLIAGYQLMRRRK